MDRQIQFKPSRKNKDFFLFLPDPILAGWLKILHLTELEAFLTRDAKWAVAIICRKEKLIFFESKARNSEADFGLLPIVQSAKEFDW